MALVDGRRVSVGAAAVQVFPDASTEFFSATGSTPIRVVVRNKHASQIIDMGGPGVTSGAGFPLDPGEAIGYDIENYAEALDIYAIASGAATPLAIFMIGPMQG